MCAHDPADDQWPLVVREIRMHLSWTMAAAVAMAVFAGVAMAQERPLIAPTKDVTIEYTLKMPGDSTAQARTSRTSIAAGGQRMRIEGMGQPGYLIIDRNNGRTIMVAEAQHMYVEMPFDPSRAGPLLLRDSMKFVRQGAETIAGMRCTVWRIQGARGSGTACISDDGVVLRADSDGQNGHVTMTATSVSFGPLPDTLFQPPAGYQKMTMPPGAGQPGMPQQTKPQP
jgi:hypothetical protein